MDICDTCYFCTSTFQLLSILSVAEERNEVADLYIDPQFLHAEEYSRIIAESGLFRRVVIIDSERVFQEYFSSRAGIVNHFQIARSYLSVNQISGIILQGEYYYRNMFVSTKAYMPRMVMLHYIKENWNFTVWHFDDGVGSYYGNRAYQPKRTDAWIRRLLFGRKANDIQCERYLFSPAFFRTINPSSNVKVHKIKGIWSIDKKREIFNKLFPVSKEEIIQEKLIILEEPIRDILANQEADTINEAYFLIIDKFGRDQSIIKRHPRSKEKVLSDYKYYRNAELPFEAICINSSVENKVLVTYGSTAVATPKMLLDQEPYVILLYHLAKTKNSTVEALDGFFHCLQQSYEKPDRVLIPRDMSELNKILDTIVR